MPRAQRLLAAGLMAAVVSPMAAAEPDDDVMIVFDGSNSMWGQIDGISKIEIAQDVIDELLGDWATSRKVGLMAYGHRRRGDCEDIQILVEPASGVAESIRSKIDSITPTGKTPLTAVVRQAAERLAYRDRPATVVLISDGLESCKQDPCALADDLERQGIDFTAHVVGFGLSKGEDTASLACIAEATGGRYLSAGNAEELGKALSEVGAAVAEAPPEPEYAVTLTAPERAPAGSEFVVQWTGTVDKRDYVTIVPSGADEGSRDHYARVADQTERTLIAPAETGSYEVRYVLDDGGKTLATAPIEITEPEITLTVPETALAGARFQVEWSRAVHPRDYVTIVPAGAEEGSRGHYVRVSDQSERDLRAPAEIGLYEVRYVLDEGARTLASATIEITEPKVALSAPETALAGSDIPVEWTGAVHHRDSVTIVPAGAEEGIRGNYVRVGDRTERDLKAPAETGLYEIRYVLDEGGRTLASATIEITEPEVTLTAPETALAGSQFRVQWTGAVDNRDYVTIVPAGAEEGSRGNYVRVADRTARDLRAPAETGLYEVRYVLDEGARTMASAPIEILAPEVTLDAPGEIRAGDEIRIRWTGAVHHRDYVTIVPMGSEDDVSGDYFRVSQRSAHRLTAPETTGLYELRYVLDQGKKVLARRQIEVLEADAALEKGASLTAPETASPGATVEVAWSVDNPASGQRISLAREDQALFTWIDAVEVGDAPKVSLTMPEEPGNYELRFLDLSSKSVLARRVIRVE